MVGGDQAKKRSVGGEPWRSRPSSSASSSAMFAAPSSGSVTSNLNWVTLVPARRAYPSSPSPPRGEGRARRAHPSISAPGGGEGRGEGECPRPTRRRPLEPRLARGSRLIEPAHRRRDRRLVDQVRVLLRLARDLNHRVAELVERLLRLRLRGLDHQRF